MRLLASHNQHPDTLKLQLESSLSSRDVSDIYLQLQFTESWQPLLQGKVKITVTGGILTLKTQKLKILSLDPRIDPQSLIWVITPLDFPITNLKLATVATEDSTAYLQVNFSPTPAHLSLEPIEGLWSHDITPNQHAILERKIAHYLYQQQWAPQVCSVQLGLDQAPLLFHHPNPPSSIATEPLAAISTTIYQAKTNDFLALVKLAELNPLQDLAGGNFLATQLPAINLSTANLSYSNFRGADLTDIDLSEANLSHAKLRGADLSGAYLGNANLSYSDLQKASLALANLIGADLRGANLTEANLTNANLSGANLEGAKFADNPGVSDDTKLQWQERGAIIAQ